MSYYRHGPRPPGFGGIGVPALTPLVKQIIIACVVVWLVQYALHAAGYDLAGWFRVVPSRVFTGWIWQPITYMFLHNPVSPFHILFNMLMLWMFGGELETYWGRPAFLRYYLVAGAGGGISAAILGMLSGGVSAVIPTIGASGALFGLFVAYGMVFANRTVLLFLFFPMKARTMAWILIGINFFYLLSQPGSGVSHIAHLGGALAGFLYLKRAWRIGEFYRELRWKIRRRRFRTISRDDDQWLN